MGFSIPEGWYPVAPIRIEDLVVVGNPMGVYEPTKTKLPLPVQADTAAEAAIVFFANYIVFDALGSGSGQCRNYQAESAFWQLFSYVRGHLSNRLLGMYTVHDEMLEFIFEPNGKDGFRLNSNHPVLRPLIEMFGSFWMRLPQLPDGARALIHGNAVLLVSADVIIFCGRTIWKQPDKLAQ
jgi:hypothetical protein